MRNFDFQGQVPMAAIIQAAQNKALMEFQGQQAKAEEKRRRIAQNLEAINAIGSMVGSAVSASKAKQTEDARRTLAELMLSGSDPVAMGEGGMVNVPHLGGDIPVAQMGMRRDTPEYRSEMQSAIMQADPKAGIELAKAEATREGPSQLQQLQMTRLQQQIDREAEAMTDKEKERAKIHLEKVKGSLREELEEAKRSMVTADTVERQLSIIDQMQAKINKEFPYMGTEPGWVRKLSRYVLGQSAEYPGEERALSQYEALEERKRSLQLKQMATRGAFPDVESVTKAGDLGLLQNGQQITIGGRPAMFYR